MQTLKELKKYIEDECFSKVSVGKEFADYHFIVWPENGRYFFAYCERGNLSAVKGFDTEKEAVAYTLDMMENDKWTKAHPVAYTWSVKDILDAERELKDMNISFERNDDPYFDKEHGALYRIFVFGKDVLKLSDFSKKYGRLLENAGQTKVRLMSDITELSRKIKGFRLCTDRKEPPFSAYGYYFDDKNSVWRVFKTEKGHEPRVYLETKYELRALNELYKVIFEIYEAQTEEIPE